MLLAGASRLNIAYFSHSLRSHDGLLGATSLLPSIISGARRFQSTTPEVPLDLHRAARFDATIRTLDSRRLGPGDITLLKGLMKFVYDRHYLQRRQKPTRIGGIWQFRYDVHPDECKQRGMMRLAYAPECEEEQGHDGHKQSQSRAAFPPNTRGWFYYYLPPHRPAVAGEVRFRVAPSTGAPRFESGSDLLLPTGSPFNIPLIRIAHGESFTMLRDILLRDRLVEPHVMEHCARICQRKNIAPHSRQLQYLSSLQDPVVFNLSYPAFKMKVWANDELHDLKLIGRFGHWADTWVMPYEGLVAVRLERSTLPIHAGQRVLLFRVVQILKPVRCVLSDYNGGIQVPSEGGLVMRRFTPVNINLDARSASSQFGPLRVLYEQDASASQPQP